MANRPETRKAVSDISVSPRTQGSSDSDTVKHSFFLHLKPVADGDKTTLLETEFQLFCSHWRQPPACGNAFRCVCMLVCVSVLL